MATDKGLEDVPEGKQIIFSSTTSLCYHPHYCLPHRTPPKHALPYCHAAPPIMLLRRRRTTSLRLNDLQWKSELANM